MVLEDGTLGRQLGCEGGVSFHEISLLLQTDKRELVPRLCPLTVSTHQVVTRMPARGLCQAGIRISDLLDSRTRRNKCLVI